MSRPTSARLTLGRRDAMSEDTDALHLVMFPATAPMMKPAKGTLRRRRP